MTAKKMKLGEHRGVKEVLEESKKPSGMRSRRDTPYLLEDLKRLQMNIPTSLHKQLKDAAYSMDLEITHIIENLAEDWLQSKRDQDWTKKAWEK